MCPLPCQWLLYLFLYSNYHLIQNFDSLFSVMCPVVSLRYDELQQSIHSMISEIKFFAVMPINRYQNYNVFLCITFIEFALDNFIMYKVHSDYYNL